MADLSEANRKRGLVLAMGMLGGLVMLEKSGQADECKTV
jgi:hypothetical protein